jgi:hypothetical protein
MSLPISYKIENNGSDDKRDNNGYRKKMSGIPRSIVEHPSPSRAIFDFVRAHCFLLRNILTIGLL